MNKLKQLLLIVFSMILFVGCNSLSDEIKKRAENQKQKISSTASEVKQLEEQYNQILQEKEFLKQYAEEDTLSDYFDDGNTLVERARNKYENNVQTLIEKNDGSDESKLSQELREINSTLAAAKDSARTPKKVLSKLEDIKNNISKYEQESEQSLNNIADIYNNTIQFTEPYRDNYPTKTEYISTKLDSISNAVMQPAEANFQALQEELSSNAPDLLEVYYAHKNITSLEPQINEFNEWFTAEVKSLENSYTKILKDVRVDYFVKIGRSSWDQSGYDEENHYYSMKKVSPKTYKYLTEQINPNKTLAKYSSGFGTELDVYIDKGVWNSLEVDATDDWPARDHDRASYWVQDWTWNYYHKYVVVKNGEVDTTQWESVDKEFFEAHAENIGMTLYSKPEGVYAHNAVVTPSPPAMTYVDNPKYGEWKKDENGNSFWEFYGKYALISSMFNGSGHHYYRSDYNSWNRNYRNRRAYYGATGGSRKYGTRGSQLRRSNAYKRSNYSRRMANSRYSSYSRSRVSKVSRRASRSIRAGGARRGGGPGGRGK